MSSIRLVWRPDWNPALASDQQTGWCLPKHRLPFKHWSLIGFILPVLFDVDEELVAHWFHMQRAACAWHGEARIIIMLMSLW